MAKLRPWHWVAVTLVSIVVLLLAWFGIAYGGLPRLWSRHEHKRIGRRDAIISSTAQDIPADPVNLRVEGGAAAIGCAFRRAGWSPADQVSVRSGIRIAASVVLHRPYPEAPISSLYVHDRVQDMAFQQDEGGNADRRHHVRFWRIGPNDWLAAATFDKGVGLSLFTLQITHRIGADLDGEREKVGRLLTASGARPVGEESSRIAPGMWHRNGGGSRYRTDGIIRVLALPGGCAGSPSPSSQQRLGSRFIPAFPAARHGPQPGLG